MRLFKIHTPSSRLEEINSQLKRHLPEGADYLHFITRGDTTTVMTPWDERPITVLTGTDHDVLCIDETGNQVILAQERYNRQTDTLDLELTGAFAPLAAYVAAHSGAHLATRERQRAILQSFIRASGQHVSLREWFDEYVPGQADALLLVRIEDSGELLASVNLAQDPRAYAVRSGDTLLGTLTYQSDSQRWTWQMHGDWPPAPQAHYYNAAVTDDSVPRADASHTSPEAAPADAASPDATPADAASTEAASVTPPHPEPAPTSPDADPNPENEEPRKSGPFRTSFFRPNPNAE